MVTPVLIFQVSMTAPMILRCNQNKKDGPPGTKGIWAYLDHFSSAAPLSQDRSREGKAVRNANPGFPQGFLTVSPSPFSPPSSGLVCGAFDDLGGCELWQQVQKDRARNKVPSEKE